jgi:aldose sugar dehydrogenase
MTFLPDGRMLITEKAGTLRLLDANGAMLGAISGLPQVMSEGQGGLMDVAIDPAFASNRRIYFTFSEADQANPSLNSTAVGRAVLDVNTRSLSQVTVIYRQQPKVASTLHFGSRLEFDRGGHLYVTLGERSIGEQRPLAQDLSVGNGKVMRITTDGAAAPGNPSWNVAGALPEVWTLGHRNPQGAAIHPDTGELWTSEHGAQGGDEINRVLGGRNYGWPLVSRSQEYGTTTPIGVPSRAGFEDAKWVWERPDGSAWTGGAKGSTAPAGMIFYSGTAVPQWRGNLFVGSLSGKVLWRLTLEGNSITAQERLLVDQGERIRDVNQGPDGALYLLTDTGKLLRFGA